MKLMKKNMISFHELVFCPVDGEDAPIARYVIDKFFLMIQNQKVEPDCLPLISGAPNEIITINDIIYYKNLYQIYVQCGQYKLLNNLVTGSLDLKNQTNYQVEQAMQRLDALYEISLKNDEYFTNLENDDIMITSENKCYLVDMMSE